MIKEIIAFGAISVGSVMGAACSEDGKYVPVDSGDSAGHIDGVQGNEFKIKRIGTNVFKLSGDDREAGTMYLSEHCKVLSVGTWQLTGVYGSNVSSVAVTVEGDDCLPEIR